MPEIKINSVYQQLFENGRLRPDIRYFVIYGGRRSGKSFDITQILDITAMSEPRHFIPTIRKVGATLKDSVYSEHCKFFSRNNIKARLNKTDKEITLPNESRIRGIDLAGEMTVKQFIELTRTSYGGERIAELESLYK